MIDITDESYESDLTEEESNELLLMCGHAIGPQLSSAAQAVLDAYFHSGEEAAPAVAAALRAATNYCPRDRRILMTIADELEGQK